MHTDFSQNQRDLIIAFLVFLACIFYSFFVQDAIPSEVPAALVGH